MWRKTCPFELWGNYLIQAKNYRLIADSSIRTKLSFVNFIRRVSGIALGRLRHGLDVWNTDGILRACENRDSGRAYPLQDTSLALALFWGGQAYT